MAKAKPPAKRPAGRPSLYKSEYDKQAFKLCLLGATDVELADFFEVNPDTIKEWRKVHPSFSATLKKAKDQADATVANKLYRRALGYSCKEDKIFNHNGVPLIVPTKKHYPPDVTACIFWLKNRQSAKWRDKPENDAGEGDLAAALKKIAQSLPGA